MNEKNRIILMTYAKGLSDHCSLSHKEILEFISDELLAISDLLYTNEAITEEDIDNLSLPYLLLQRLMGDRK